jgi:hypothetical protein
LHVPDDLLGTEVKCPACHHAFMATQSGFGPALDLAQPSAMSAPQQPTMTPPPQRAKLNADVDPHAEPVAADGHFQETHVWHGAAEKPQKVQAIGIMMLIGGILALLTGITWAATCIGLVIPMTYYSFVLGVMAIVKASKLLGDRAHEERPPQAIAIMQIVNIVSFDIFNLVFGIITLVLLSEPEVKAYFRRS